MIHRPVKWVTIGILGIGALAVLAGLIGYREELAAKYCSYRVRTSTDFFLDALMAPLGTTEREAVSTFLETPQGQRAFSRRTGLLDIALTALRELPEPVGSMVRRFFSPDMTAQGDFSDFLGRLIETELIPGEPSPEERRAIQARFVEFTQAVRAIHQKRDAYIDRLVEVADRTGQFVEFRGGTSPGSPRVSGVFLSKRLGGFSRAYHLAYHHYPELLVFFSVLDNCRDNLIDRVSGVQQAPSE